MQNSLCATTSDAASGAECGQVGPRGRGDRGDATGDDDAAASCAKSTGATRSAVRAAMERRRSILGDIPSSVTDRGACNILPAYPLSGTWHTILILCMCKIIIKYKTPNTPSQPKKRRERH